MSGIGFGSGGFAGFERLVTVTAAATRTAPPTAATARGAVGSAQRFICRRAFWPQKKSVADLMLLSSRFPLTLGMVQAEFSTFEIKPSPTQSNQHLNLSTKSFRSNLIYANNLKLIQAFGSSLCASATQWCSKNRFALTKSKTWALRLRQTCWDVWD